MTKSVSIGQLLNQPTAGGFGQVLNRARQLRKLTQSLQKMVDAPLNQHIVVANIRDNIMIVGADSAVWHTRVRYLAPLILEQMQRLSGLEELRGIEFRVQPSATHLEPPATSPANPRRDDKSSQDAATGSDLIKTLKQITEKNSRQS